MVIVTAGYWSECAALTLRCMLGEPCPPVLTRPIKISALDNIKATVTALRKYWKCFSIFHTSSPEADNCFVPDLKFTAPVGWPPAEFPPKDYYLVYDEETSNHWKLEVTRLVLNTNLTCPDTQLFQLKSW